MDRDLIAGLGAIAVFLGVAFWFVRLLVTRRGDPGPLLAEWQGLPRVVRLILTAQTAAIAALFALYIGS